MGDSAGPQQGVQVLPIDGERQEAACGRRIAVEADGGRGGSRDVACGRGELICDGGRGRIGMRTWRENSSATFNWKKKSSENAACPRKMPVSPPCALSAIPR